MIPLNQLAKDTGKKSRNNSYNKGSPSPFISNDDPLRGPRIPPQDLESEKALLLDSFNRVYTSTAVTHDSALQRNLNGMTVSGRIPQDIAQKIMVEHQRGQGQYLIEPGKNRWLLPTGGSPTPNSKSGGEPIQQAPIQQPGGMTKAKARELMLKMKAAGKENDPRYKTLQMMAE